MSREPFAAEDPPGSQEPRGHPEACRNQNAAGFGQRPSPAGPRGSASSSTRRSITQRRPLPCSGHRCLRPPPGHRRRGRGGSSAPRLLTRRASEMRRATSAPKRHHRFGIKALSKGGHGELAARGSGSSASSRIEATEPALSRRVRRGAAGAAGCSARWPRVSCLQGPPRPPTAPKTWPVE